MCWMCANPALTKGDVLARMADQVEEYGWAIQCAQGDRVHPPWAYTVGLTLRGLPELVVTGLKVQDAGDLLDDEAHYVVDHGQALWPGKRLTRTSGCSIEVVELPHPDAHLLTAVEMYRGRSITALQLVWSDDRGHWPWDVGFRGRRGGQPVLGPRAVDR
jgi:hypothetical protein